ncbi:MAG: DUF6882 domain-containing protein [Dongia sp.]
MENPEWYPDWRHEAFKELEAKNARLRGEFRIGDWPRFDYDIPAGTLTFSEEGVAKVIAEIQVAGSTSRGAGNWRWAWANTSVPPARTTDAALVRAFGEERGIPELVHESVRDVDLEALGWEMVAVMVRVTNALGAYRPPRGEGSSLFLTVKSVAWVG